MDVVAGYVAGDPINFRDPWGLKKGTATSGGDAAGGGGDEDEDADEEAPDDGFRPCREPCQAKPPTPDPGPSVEDNAAARFFRWVGGLIGGGHTAETPEQLEQEGIRQLEAGDERPSVFEGDTPGKLPVLGTPFHRGDDGERAALVGLILSNELRGKGTTEDDLLELAAPGTRLIESQVMPPSTLMVTPLGGGGVRPPNLTPPGGGRRAAFREAKRQSGVPVSQQPKKVGPNVDRKGNKQPGRTYEFDVPDEGGGTREVRIREDSGGHDFGPGDPQNRGPHFNDESGGHYDY